MQQLCVVASNTLTTELLSGIAVDSISQFTREVMIQVIIKCRGWGGVSNIPGSCVNHGTTEFLMGVGNYKK